MLRTRMTTMGTRMTRTTRMCADFSVPFCLGQNMKRFNIAKAFKSNGQLRAIQQLKKSATIRPIRVIRVPIIALSAHNMSYVILLTIDY